jgi:hypothetical protein
VYWNFDTVFMVKNSTVHGTVGSFSAFAKNWLFLPSAQSFRVMNAIISAATPIRASGGFTLILRNF